MTSRLIAVTIIAVLLSAPALGLAQDQGALRIALVNVPKVRTDFAERQQAFDQLRQWAAAKDQIFLELQDYLLLPDADFTEVITILEMPQPRPTDRQARLDQLRKLSDDKLTEFVTLQAKAQRTPEENDRYQTYAEQFQRCQERLADYGENARMEFEQRGAEIDNRLNGRILDAVKTVASRDGYNLVLSMATVLYALAPADDITDMVLAELNPASAAAPAPAAEPVPEPAPAPGGGNGG